MSSRVYWIAKFENGARLGIMARPRGEEWLEDEMGALARQQVGVVVSLLEPAEVAELGLREEGELCGAKGMEFIGFPIPDRKVPLAGEKLEAFIGLLARKIEAGSSVVVHCR